MTQGALAQHIRPLLQSCNTALWTANGLTFRRCHICYIRCELLRDRDFYSQVLILQTYFGNHASVEGGRVVWGQEGTMHSKPNPGVRKCTSENPVAKI